MLGPIGSYVMPRWVLGPIGSYVMPRWVLGLDFFYRVHSRSRIDECGCSGFYRFVVLQLYSFTLLFWSLTSHIVTGLTGGGIWDGGESARQGP